MNTCALTLAGSTLQALGSGALFWPEHDLLCVSDLHLGKAERIARRGGSHLPPYETRDTLTRLSNDLEITRARTVICLGDSFDDLSAAQALQEDDRLSAVPTAPTGKDDLLFEILPFSSRSGFPDFLAWKDGGLVATGFYDADWRFDASLTAP